MRNRDTGVTVMMRTTCNTPRAGNTSSVGTRRAYSSGMVLATRRHTHQVRFRMGSHADGFLFTPSAPDRAEDEARGRIVQAHGAPFLARCSLEVTELKSAADTRARGVLRSERGRFFYEVA